MRIGADALTKIRGKPELVGEHGDTLVSLVRNAKNVCNKMKIFNSGQEFIKIGVIGDICNNPFAFERIVLYRAAVNENVSAIEGYKTGSGLKCGGFSCSVMTYKSVYFSAPYVKRQIVYGNLFSVSLGKQC